MSLNLTGVSWTIESKSVHEALNDQEIILFLEKYGRIFQNPKYMAAFSGKVDFHLVRDSANILCVLPITIFKKHKLKGAHIPPYAHYCGPVYGDIELDVQSKCLDLLLKNLRQIGFIEFKIPIAGSCLEFTEQNGIVTAAQTHIVSASTEYSIESIHKSKRRYLKKLIKLLDAGGLKKVEGANAHSMLIELQKKTAQSKNFSMHFANLHKIIESLNIENSYSIVVTDANDVPLAGAFCPFDNFSAYHIINASVTHSDSLLNKANILSAYLAVKKANDMGLDFDFEGSSIPGVAHFYRMMGGAPTLFHRIQFANNLAAKVYVSIKQFIQL